jgi:hypothetical protein
MRHARLLATLLLLVGCGDSGNDPNPTPGRNIDGAWQIAFTDMEINGVEDCTLEQLNVMFDQTGATVHGSHEEAQLNCSISGLVVQAPGVITGGTVGMSSITIHMDQPVKTRTFVGIFDSDTQMSGTVEWTTEDGVQLVSGLWTAVKE